MTLMYVLVVVLCPILEFFTHLEMSPILGEVPQIANFYLHMVLMAMAMRVLYHANTSHNMGPPFLSSYLENLSISV